MPWSSEPSWMLKPEDLDAIDEDKTRLNVTCYALKWAKTVRTLRAIGGSHLSLSPKALKWGRPSQGIYEDHA